jgi:deoxyribose-phosphate aldolase
MVQTARSCGLRIKLIIETALLTREEKKIAAGIVKSSGADYIKTSTGFFGGVTVQDVIDLRQWTGPEVKVKAAGGIKTKEFAVQLIEAGADRLGTSSGVALIS